MMQILLAIVWRIGFFIIGSCCALVALLSPALETELRLVSAFVMAVLTAVALFWPRKFVVPAVLAMLLIFIAWERLEPSNDRDWQEDLSRLAWAEQNADEVIIHNVRDFNYRSETDFDKNYVTKKVHLSELSSLDLFASYWAGKSIAHIFVSFGFAERDYVTFSIEVRKTKGQAYSSIDGFFRNFELIYVVAEERDLVGLRTIYRQPNEQVHILRMRYYKENAIKLFLQYLANLNSLVKKPAFYNTLTTNCTTQVLANAQDAGGSRRLHYDWRLLFSGYTPEYLYRIGNLDHQFSVEELMQKGLVNSRAQDVSNAEQFSRNIREGVPRPPLFKTAPE